MTKDNIPVSTSSPTNIFAIPDTTIVIGTDIFGVPLMLASNCTQIIYRNINAKENDNNSQKVHCQPISNKQFINSITAFYKVK